MKKGLTILCGLLLSWGVLPSNSAVAGPECSIEAEQTPAAEAIGTTPLTSTPETVVVISGSPDSAGLKITVDGGPAPDIRVITPSEVVVKGGPSQSVRVIAPSNVAVSAIGGDGAAGKPGTPGN